MSILITTVLNSASDRLAISLSLNSISGVLICYFIWAMFLCLAPPVNVVRGRALGIHQGRATAFALLWCYVWGKGQRGNNPCSLGSCPTFHHFPHFPQVVCTLLGADSQSGWVCVRSRILWASAMNSPVRLGICPAFETPTGFYSLRFWVFSFLVYQSPPWPGGLLPCCGSSLPGFPFLSLLLFWMNVSSLTPLLLEFHAIWFSGSSVVYCF